MEKIEIDKEVLGQRLRRARRDLDLSQRQLGEDVQVHYTTISRIEKGRYDELYTSVLLKLATRLKVSLDWLLGRKDTPEIDGRKG